LAARRGRADTVAEATQAEYLAQRADLAAVEEVQAVARVDRAAGLATAGTIPGQLLVQVAASDDDSDPLGSKAVLDEARLPNGLEGCGGAEPGGRRIVPQHLAGARHAFRQA